MEKLMRKVHLLRYLLCINVKYWCFYSCRKEIVVFTSRVDLTMSSLRDDGPAAEVAFKVKSL